MKRIFTCLSTVLVLIVIVGALQADQGFITTASGLAYKDLRVGSGTVALPGKIAVVHFIGWINDDGQKGKEIFNSRRHPQPVAFVIGTDRVMQGWSEGVTGMQPGGTRMVRIPPELGYGNKAVEDLVPPHTPLIFLFELLEVK